jgi:rhamnose transport system substrate-binding protein
MKSPKRLGLAAALLMSGASLASAQTVLEGGRDVDMVLLPKFLGILVFDQANEGAQEAHAELGNPGELLFVGPTPENSVAGQIEIMTTSATQGQGAVMLSNNAGDQIAPAAVAAQAAGTRVVTWDSPIPGGEGEDVFVAQVDFGSIGVVMADMAHSILGGEGQMAVLSATPDAANQNAWIAAMQEALKGEKYAGIELVDVVYGDDQAEVSYNRALALVDSHPDLGLIMSPTTVGIQASAKAMQDEGLCDKDQDLGPRAAVRDGVLHDERLRAGVRLWDFRDLGYLTYYTAYGLATGQLTGEIGETFTAGRMGDYTIEEDPGRAGAKRILMGPFTVYTSENVEAAAQ